MSFLIGASSISKQFGGTTLFSDMSVTVLEKDRIGIIGPNGKGKSTFLRILAGKEDVDSGSVSRSKQLTVSFAEQLVNFPDLNSIQDLIDKELVDKASLGLNIDINRILANLDRFGIVNLDTSLSTLSGGEKKKVQLAFIFAEESDLILLDEPSNHLDLDSILQLEEIINNQPQAIVMISHDRWLLEACSEEILEINPIYPNGYFISEGAYTKYLERKEAFLVADTKAYEALKNRAKSEQEWLRQGVKARTTKSKHRQDTAYSLLDAVKSQAARRQQKKAKIEFTASDRRTKNLVEFESVSHSYDTKTLFNPFDYILTEGKKLGILGPNGSGKSTILKLILGEIQPTKGRVKKVNNLKISYFSQFSSYIDSSLTLDRVFSPDSDSVLFRGSSLHVAAWAARFGFDPTRLKQPYGSLSGGEKARVRISQLMLESPDILLLDEPTNDLDIATLEILEESLSDFRGALLLVTHDRYLLAAVCDSFLGLDGNGGIKVFASYQQYIDDLEVKAKQVKKSQKIPQAKVTSHENKVQKKLSFKEQHELNNIEGVIQATEEEIKTLQEKLNKPMTDANTLQELCDQLAAAQGKVEQLYARWEELDSRQV